MTSTCPFAVSLIKEVCFRTFPALCRPAELYKKCYELSEKLAEDLKEEAIMVSVLFLFVLVTQGEADLHAGPRNTFLPPVTL